MYKIGFDWGIFGFFGPIWITISRLKLFLGVKPTHCQVGAVVCVHANGLKEPWCLAGSDPETTAVVLINHYASRWTIEPQCRDTKDLRFGMSLSATSISEAMRRDQLRLVNAFAMTLLGTVGESLCMDRLLKANSSKTRSHSLFRQGCMLQELIPNMPEHRLAPLAAAFAKAVSGANEFSGRFTQPECGELLRVTIPVSLQL